MNGSILKKLLSSIAIILCTSYFLKAYSDDLFIPLIDKADIARQEFEDAYKDLCTQAFFVTEQGVENENPFKCSNIDKNMLESGPVLLGVIEWLNKNKKSDANGLMLLHKLNRYLYLQFRHFVGQLNIDKENGGRLLALVHDFYKFKVPAATGSVEANLKYIYPFQEAISKAMLFILIVNASDLSCAEKSENVAYFLDKIRRELIAVKDKYNNSPLSLTDIKNFVELLQAYATKGPLLAPNYFKRILVAAAIVAVSLVVAWFVWKKFIKPEVKEMYDFFLQHAVEKGNAFVDHGVQEGTAFVDHSVHQGDEFIANTLNQLHNTGAKIVPYCPLVPKPAQVPGQQDDAPSEDLAQDDFDVQDEASDQNDQPEPEADEPAGEPQDGPAPDGQAGSKGWWASLFGR